MDLVGPPAGTGRFPTYPSSIRRSARSPELSPGHDRAATPPGITGFSWRTTYRRDGRPVPTPVGLVADGGELLVLTQRNSGNVERIRNNATVEVTHRRRPGKGRRTLIPCRGLETTAARTDPGCTSTADNRGFAGCTSYRSSSSRSPHCCPPPRPPQASTAVPRRVRPP
ncbi:pyridoxamine 5'-phosphate oxidase family protein [Plantactinospora sp. KLBMP9567]|uniref:pyridoxamine 5'-phosphate oxidase family protein n=1 Tax=Plantactinospora sp. KLBMP9567 TaxID=3085900 RepID=UPI003990D6AE